MGCTPLGLSTRCLLQVPRTHNTGQLYLAASRDAQPSLIAVKINAFCFMSWNRGISLSCFFFFSPRFVFFSFLKPPSKSSLPPPSAASFPCKQAHGTHGLTHHTHGNTLMAPPQRALPGAGTGSTRGRRRRAGGQGEGCSPPKRALSCPCVSPEKVECPQAPAPRAGISKPEGSNVEGGWNSRPMAAACLTQLLCAGCRSNEALLRGHAAPAVSLGRSPIHSFPSLCAGS